MASIEFHDKLLLRESFAQFMASRGVLGEDLFAALRLARQLGKGLFVCGLSRPLADDAEHNEFHSPYVGEKWREHMPPLTRPAQLVAAHLPTSVRDHLVFVPLEMWKGTCMWNDGPKVPRSDLKSKDGLVVARLVSTANGRTGYYVSYCILDSRFIEHQVLQMQNGLQGPPACLTCGRACDSGREAAEWLASFGLVRPLCLDGANAYDEALEGIAAEIDKHDQSQASLHRKALAVWLAPSVTGRLTEGLTATMDRSLLVKLANRFSHDLVAISKHIHKDDLSAVHQSYMKVLDKRRALVKDSDMCPPCLYCPRNEQASNEAFQRRRTVSFLSVARPSKKERVHAAHVPPPPRPSPPLSRARQQALAQPTTLAAAMPPSLAAEAAPEIDAEVREANFQAKQRKQALKRGHKAVQANLQELKQLELQGRSGNESMAPASEAPLAAATTTTTKKKPIAKGKPCAQAKPRDWEAERAMQKIRIVSQRHLQSAPVLNEHEFEPLQRRKPRPRKQPQGDRRLAQRLAAEELL